MTFRPFALIFAIIIAMCSNLAIADEQVPYKTHFFDDGTMLFYEGNYDQMEKERIPFYKFQEAYTIKEWSNVDYNEGAYEFLFTTDFIWRDIKNRGVRIIASRQENVAGREFFHIKLKLPSNETPEYFMPMVARTDEYNNKTYLVPSEIYRAFMTHYYGTTYDFDKTNPALK